MAGELEEVRETIVAVDALLTSPEISRVTKRDLQRYRSELVAQLELLLDLPDEFLQAS